MDKIFPPHPSMITEIFLEKGAAALSPASFWIPDYICQSAWLEHAPFAFWLCGALRPRRFVELGTHRGYSYFAFCQAIQRLSTGTAAYAVDTWAGDEHTGYYGDEVLQAVAKHNRERYAGFSELVRSNFEAALPYFEDGSIDLLHVDGRHFYEDVKRDFESWRPKLAEDAVVLFHDTNVRERDFGVWRLFEELAAGCPAFCFLHGHGLGVIAPGQSPPSTLMPLFSAPREATAQVRAAYATLGGALAFRRALAAKHEAITAMLPEGADTSHASADILASIGDWDPQVQEIRIALEVRGEQLSKLRAALAEAELAREQEVAATADRVAETERARQREAAATATAAAALAERGRLEAVAHQAEQELLAARTAMETAIAETEQARQHEAAAAAVAAAAYAERGRLEAETEQMRRELPAIQAALTVAVVGQLSAETERDALLYSATWRATRPLRRAGEALPAPARRAARRLLRGSYWLVTMQLGRRLEERRAAQAALSTPGSLSLAVTRPVSDLEPAQMSLPNPLPTTEYERWATAYDTLSDADRVAIRAHIGRLSRMPLISVVMPSYETPERLLREAIASVRAQLYSNWELCIADDASPSDTVQRVLREEAASDPRIKWMRRESNGHIAAATNSALALATGEFVALMDHDDLLPEQALYEVAVELEAHPDTDMIYTDEDHVDSAGRRLGAYFKPDWNIDLLLSHNVFSHLGVYRRSLLERIGGLREGLDGSQDYDLALRSAAATEARRIRHIPTVLYHWRRMNEESSFSQTQLERCIDAARRSIHDYLYQLGVEADVLPAPAAPLWNRVRWPVPDPAPRVSLIVPSRDQPELLARCAGGLLHRTDYPNLEVLIVDNESSDPSALGLLARLKEDRRIRILPFPGPFNYSAINNAAVREATGDIIVLLNNDIDVIEGGWLREMVSHAVRPDVGAVGAKLLYGDGRIQHAGVVLGVGSHLGGPGLAGHFGHFEPEASLGYYGQYVLGRETSAATAACLALRREVYEAAGGMDAENLPVSYNDVDLCLRIRALGLRVVWTPFAELHHLESASRGQDRTPEQIARAASEGDYMRDRWGPVLDADPFYNPNFSREDHTFKLASPPRRQKPWRRQA